MKQEIKQDLTRLTSGGVDIMDLYKRFGAVIFRAKVLGAQDTIQKLTKGREGQIVDLVNEDQVLQRRIDQSRSSGIESSRSSGPGPGPMGLRFQPRPSGFEPRQSGFQPRPSGMNQGDQSYRSQPIDLGQIPIIQDQGMIRRDRSQPPTSRNLVNITPVALRIADDAMSGRVLPSRKPINLLTLNQSSVQANNDSLDEEEKDFASQLISQLSGIPRQEIDQRRTDAQVISDMLRDVSASPVLSKELLDQIQTIADQAGIRLDQDPGFMQTMNRWIDNYVASLPPETQQILDKTDNKMAAFIDVVRNDPNPNNIGLIDMYWQVYYNAEADRYQRQRQPGFSMVPNQQEDVTMHVEQESKQLPFETPSTRVINPVVVIGQQANQQEEEEEEKKVQVASPSKKIPGKGNIKSPKKTPLKSSPISMKQGDNSLIYPQGSRFQQARDEQLQVESSPRRSTSANVLASEQRQANDKKLADISQESKSGQYEKAIGDMIQGIETYLQAETIRNRKDKTELESIKGKDKLNPQTKGVKQRIYNLIKRLPSGAEVQHLEAGGRMNLQQTIDYYTNQLDVFYNALSGGDLSAYNQVNQLEVARSKRDVEKALLKFLQNIQQRLNTAARSPASQLLAQNRGQQVLQWRHRVPLPSPRVQQQQQPTNADLEVRDLLRNAIEYQNWGLNFWRDIAGNLARISDSFRTEDQSGNTILYNQEWVNQVSAIWQNPSLARSTKEEETKKILDEIQKVITQYYQS